MASQDTSFTTRVSKITATWAQAVNDFIHKGRDPQYVTSTGSGTAYVITLPATSLYSAYAAGDTFTFKAHAANTGAATLQIVGASTLTAKNLYLGGSALSGGEIQIGDIVTVKYDGTQFQIKTGTSVFRALAQSFGSSLVGFLQSGSGAIAETVEEALQRTVWADQFGAVGDGTTDDYTNFVKAYTATPTGGTLRINKVFYLAGASTEFEIAKSIKLIFDPGAKLKFDHHSTSKYYVKISASDVTLVDPWIDGGGTSRVTSAGIIVYNDAHNVRLVRPRVIDSSGTGITVEDAYDVQIDNPYVEGSWADGIHITSGAATGNITKRVTVTSPITVNTGDAGVSVVSYSTATELVQDVTITGHISIDSAASGFDLAGGKRIRYDGVIYSPGDASSDSGVRVEQDATYGTHNVYDSVVKATVVDSAGAGATVGKLVYDSIFEFQIDNATGRGVAFGSVAGTNLAERNTLTAQVYSSGSIGIDINGVEGLNCPSLAAYDSASIGISLATNVAQVVGGSWIAKNNATGSAVDNITMSAVTDVAVGSIVSIDENSNIDRTLEIAGCTRVAIGAFMGLKGVTMTNAVETGVNSNVFIGARIPDLTPVVNTTAVGNVGTGEDNLQTGTIGVNWLSNATRRVHIIIAGTTANNANAKTLKVYFGSTAILTATLTANQAGKWRVEADVISTGTDAQDYIAELTETDGAGVVNQIVQSNGSATENDGANITIKTTGEATANADIVSEMLIVEPGPH
jgi:hypothetical protein